MSVAQVSALVLPIEKPLELRTESNQRLELRRKIGQLIILGYQGRSPSDQGVKNLAKQVAKGEISGVLHLGHNIPRSAAEVRNLIDYLDNNSLMIDQPALLHALDQEGGVVQRLKPWHGVTAVDSAEEMSGVTLEEAFDTYKNLACQLSDLGFNWNLGPVVDLGMNERNPVITRLERAFSANPKIVSAYAQTFVEAHETCGIGSSFKHFPGHGSSGTDSHKGIADVSKSWNKVELRPYKQLLNLKGPTSVMTGHLLHREFDSNLPASLSQTWVRGLLRAELGYNGLVVTDDLDMKAVSDQWRVEEASILALAAGNDLVLLANGLHRIPNLPRIIANAILDEMENPEPRISPTVIDQAYARVLSFKGNLGLVRK
ncbi:MAG: glycoside hydrolase family 3 N-terminal domain-containing protein [Alphaproteobacteria bacterium]